MNELSTANGVTILLLNHPGLFGNYDNFAIKMKREEFLYYCNDCIFPFLNFDDHEKIEKSKNLKEEKLLFHIYLNRFI